MSSSPDGEQPGDAGEPDADAERAWRHWKVSPVYVQQARRIAAEDAEPAAAAGG